MGRADTPKGWVVLGTLWAEITSRTGRETAHSGAPVSRVGFTIVVRGAPFGAPSRPQAAAAVPRWRADFHY